MTKTLTAGRIPLLLLVLILAWGCYLRFSNLGLTTLASDEMNHYFVGESLRTTGEPLLPSGTRYTRGLEYSALVAAALPRFDQMEVAVRFPSAVIGSLSILLFALIAWRIAGPWPAVFATVLMVIYPEALRLSRFGRFYTLQLLSGLIGFYAAWQVLRHPLNPDGFNRRRLRRDWAWAVLSIASLAYATTVQVTTLSVAAGLAVMIAIIGLRDLAYYGNAAWRWSVPWQLTAVGGIGFLLVLTVRFEVVKELIQTALTKPMWVRLSDAGPRAVSAYYRALSAHFPLVISLSPLIFLLVLLQRRRLGGFLLCWFGVPILLHSLVFPWKSERYVLLAIPALMLAAGIAASTGATALNQFLANRLVPGRAYTRIGAWLALAGTAFIAIAALVTTPAFNVARRLPMKQESFGWRESVAILQRDSGLASLPIGSAQPLVAFHYWGRLDFTVQQALLESWRRDTTSTDMNRPYIMKPMGSPDVYAGRPTLTTAEAIRRRFAARGSVIIGIDQKYLVHRNIDPSLRTALTQEARELCQNRCGTMKLYHWTFGQADAPPPSDLR